MYAVYIISLFYIEKPSMFMNDPDYVPSVFVFSINKDKRSRYERVPGIKQLKAVPIRMVELMKFHHLFRHQVTLLNKQQILYLMLLNLLKIICLQKRMELLKRMWLQERTGVLLQNLIRIYLQTLTLMIGMPLKKDYRPARID